MVKSIHHINILVRDLEAAIPVYERILGLPLSHRDDLPERGVRAARFRVGETWLVLVQPTRSDSIPGRYLTAHGEGFFLLSFEVDSLQEEVDALGTRCFDGPTRRGAEDWQVVDLDPGLTFGAQLQFVSTGNSGDS